MPALHALPVTLRGRLIAGLIVLLAIGCATVGVTTYMTARDSLLREVTGQLQTATGLWSNCLTYRRDRDRPVAGPARVRRGQAGPAGTARESA